MNRLSTLFAAGLIYAAPIALTVLIVAAIAVLGNPQ
jgi:uncharacterized membrane protein